MSSYTKRHPIEQRGVVRAGKPNHETMRSNAMLALAQGEGVAVASMNACRPGNRLRAPAPPVTREDVAVIQRQKTAVPTHAPPNAVNAQTATSAARMSETLCRAGWEKDEMPPCHTRHVASGAQ